MIEGFSGSDVDVAGFVAPLESELDRNFNTNEQSRAYIADVPCTIQLVGICANCYEEHIVLRAPTFK
jgi:hypothetical protein